jgi:acetolactate synthase-1/2/3 large subunit
VKVSAYIIKFFKSKGIKDFFVFQGGAIMNLINEIGNDKSINYIVPHHEQSLSMQVDTYARLNGYGVGLATSGPGATNLLTGFCSAYYDSIPCFFITGQVGQFHIKKNKSYRQFGFQETDVVSIFKSVSKYATQIKDPKNIKYELEKAYYLSKVGRPGPVLLDIPFNIQISEINPKKIKSYFPPAENLQKRKKELKKVKKLEKLLFNSSKPVFLIGGGIKNPDLSKIILKKIKKNNIPFVTTWMSQDIASSSDKLNIGSIGKNGHRSANLLCAEADLIVTFGQRFAVKNIFGKFGKNAKIVAIDIDKEELKSPLIKINLGINLPISDVLKSLQIQKKNTEWGNTALDIKNKSYRIEVYKRTISQKNINPFVFFKKISRHINKKFNLHIDIGAHETWFFQSFLNKKNQKIINHCGHGAMGHAICSGIAGHYVRKNNNKNLVFIGDGGFMMNVQELNYIKTNKIPIKIVVLNNKSLGNTFLGTLQTFKKTYGNDIKTGYCAPNIKNISKGFGFKYFQVSKNNNIDKIFKKFISDKSFSILDVKISKYQPTAELNQIQEESLKVILN